MNRDRPAHDDSGENCGVDGRKVEFFGEKPEEEMELAELIYETFERIDPGIGEMVPFEKLEFIDRECYRCAAQAIFARIKSRSVICAATTS